MTDVTLIDELNAAHRRLARIETVIFGTEKPKNLEAALAALESIRNEFRQ